MAEARPNTGEINTDGYYYQQYTLSYCVLRLRDVECEYDIGSAVKDFGALDDVVFNATLACGKKLTTAIQVKHSNNNKTIDEQYLCQNPRTYLLKYCESFMEIKNKIPLEQLDQLILWTNMTIDANIRHWFEVFVPESEESDILGEESVAGISYQRYRVKPDYRKVIVQKCLEKVRRFSEKDSAAKRKKKDTNEPSEEEWEQFFKRLVFYVNVPNVVGLKAYLVRNVGNFDDLCKLVESFVATEIMTKHRLNQLFALVSLRNSVETGPYTKLIFSDLSELQCKIKELFDNGASNVLRIRASQDVDCTVARLIPVVENCLAPESKRYLVFSYETFIDKWDELKQIVSEPKLIEIGLKCIIISSVTDEEAREVENQLPALKVIFVGSDLKPNFDDLFIVNCIDNPNKNLIKNRRIKLSKGQNVTAYEIFGEKLFAEQNFAMVLELYKLTKSSVQITVNEPALDSHYRSRIAKLSSVDNTINTIDMVNQTNYSKLIIHDLPGMGKTTEMVKLTSLFRDKYQDHLVVYLHCKAAVKKWNGSVEDLICNFVKPNSELINHVVKQIIQLGKVIFILDGYDEISNSYNKSLESLVSEISQVESFKVYIATRPQCKDQLNKILDNCGLCQLKPFSEDDQLEYLKKFWNIQQVNENEKRKIIETNALSIIDQFRSMVNVYDSTLIGIPLQTHMIAVIYKDRIAVSDFKVSESHTLGFMYKEFVELKFMDSVKRNYDPTSAAHAQVIKGLKESFLHDHIMAALKMYANESESELELCCERIHHYGIILTHPDYGFIHYTYLEYFIALHLLTYSLDKNAEYNLEWYIDDTDSLVFRFMDYLVEHVDPAVNLNRSLLQSNHSIEHLVDYTPPQCARLHSDKMKEFYRALYMWKAKDIKDLFLTLIRNRMFNMFEVIYDSLRPEIKSQVRLCLDPTCSRHPELISFCLKDFKSSAPIIPVLNILLKKNPDTFVILYLTSMGDQEKSLDLMCDPSHSKLFDWFTELVPQLNFLQRAALQLFVESRMDRCIQKIIMNDNITVVRKVFSWVRNSWSVDTAKQFLTSKNLLPLFIENIEFGICEEVEPMRVEMVKCVYDLYCWAYDGQIPLDGEFFNAIQTVGTESLIDAFAATFLSNFS